MTLRLLGCSHRSHISMRIRCTTFFANWTALIILAPVAFCAPASNLHDANASFGLALLKELAKEKPDQNIFISPFSVSAALQMAAYGATGETRKEMEGTLGIAGMNFRSIGESYLKAQKSLTGMTNVELNILNSIWYASNVQLRPEFASFNSQYYGAKLTVMDFTDPRAAGNINAWVKENTKGKIERIFDGPIPGGTRAFLANVVYFKGSWADKFDPRQTKDQIFTMPNHESRTTAFMNRQGSFRYAENNGVQLLRLPYLGRKLSMLVVLPGRELSLKAYLEKLDSTSWANLVKLPLKSEIGKVALPKVRLEYGTELKDPLMTMGMRSAFSGSASFSGMSAVPLYIDSVKHKTFVDVNEEGTEAAAVTGIGMTMTAAQRPQRPFTMIVNRPYLILIQDEQTQAPLFLGIVNDPA
jgi:serine protease inhibitor